MEEWEKLCASKARRRQIARIGMDTHTAEELYFKYGHKGSPFEERKAPFRFLYILKHNPPASTTPIGKPMLMNVIALCGKSFGFASTTSCST